MADIRRARPTDSGAIVHLVRNSEETAQDVAALSDRELCARIFPDGDESHPEYDAVESFVVVESDEILGFVSVKTHHTSPVLVPGEEHTRELLWLFYDTSEYRTMIMEYVQRQYEQHGLYLRIQKSHKTAARKYWKRWNFRYLHGVELDGLYGPSLVLVWD